MSIKDLNVLRETLKIASEILERNGVAGSFIAPSVTSKRETKKEREKRYEQLINTKSRGVKPKYLKKQNG